MLDELVPGELSDGTRRALVERAEGNPFFLEELLAAFVETGAVEELPDSVQAILSARVDRLESGDKAALQAASVIGRVFWSGPTLELVGGEPVAWTVLEDRGFVRRRPTTSIGGETEYVFKHALTREVVYGSVPKARRARLHALIAAWLERTGSGRDEDAALLAHHYAQAANPADADLAWSDEPEELERLRARAVGWLRRAAELAIRRYDLDEGLAGLQRALELCEPQERLELWREIGRASALKFDGERFWEAMKSALKLTERSDGAGGDPGRPRLPDVDPLGHVAAPSRQRGGRGLDSAGARAGAAGQHGVRTRAGRPRVLESRGGACRCP